MFRKTSKIAVVFILTISLVLSFASFTALALNEDVTPPQLTKVEATSASVRPGDSINITVYATDSSGIDADDCYVRIARIPKSDSEASRLQEFLRAIQKLPDLNTLILRTKGTENS